MPETLLRPWPGGEGRWGGGSRPRWAVLEVMTEKRERR